MIIQNKRFPIIGDVGMGMIAVKIDDTIKMSDRVTLIGEGISIKEVAKHNETSIYESMCNISKSVPRIYMKENQVIGIEEGK